MNARAFVFPLLLAAGSASAQQAVAPLDLSVPERPVTAVAPGYQADPPGKYYGDTSGKPATGKDSTAAIPRRCPQDDDGDGLSGSVAAGVGYSKRGGNSNWQAATVNYCKSYFDDDGDERAVNISISTGNYDGPNGRGMFAPRAMPAAPMRHR